MASIVFVHGIGQQERDPFVLAQLWRESLSEGLFTAGAGELAERAALPPGARKSLNVRMAYYGDIFDSPDGQGPVGIGELSGDEAELVERLAWLLLSRAAEAGHLGDRDLAAAALASASGTRTDDQGWQNATRSGTAALARLRWFAPFGFAVACRFVNRSLIQVVRYLTDPHVREAVQLRLADALREPPAIIIGHSLGSVVAFDAVMRHDAPVALFMTLGSPLGIRNIVYERLEVQPPHFPPSVRWWANFVADDDIVAAVPDLTKAFPNVPEHSRFDGYLRIESGSAPHDPIHYLSKTQLGNVVAQVLQG
jgi:hypothetical protein